MPRFARESLQCSIRGKKPVEGYQNRKGATTAYEAVVSPWVIAYLVSSAVVRRSNWSMICVL